jgi:acyl carrier protein
MQVTISEIRAIIEKTNVVKDMSTLGDDLSFGDAGIDSLDVFSIFLAIEETYGIKIPDEDLDAINSIETIVDYMNKRAE